MKTYTHSDFAMMLVPEGFPPGEWCKRVDVEQELGEISDQLQFEQMSNHTLRRKLERITSLPTAIPLTPCSDIDGITDPRYDKRNALNLPAQKCHAAHSDGECSWKDCPQLRDGEPRKTGRHCPLDNRVEEEQ